MKMCQLVIVAAAVGATACPVVLAGGYLMNGAFEAPRICAWQGQYTDGGTEPVVDSDAGIDGCSCVFLSTKSGTGNNWSKAWQEVEDFSADEGDFIRLDFSARAIQYAQGAQTSVELKVGSSSIFRNIPLENNNGWQAEDEYYMGLEVPADDPDITVSFWVCGGGRELLVDDVEITVVGSDPGNNLDDYVLCIDMGEKAEGLDRDDGEPCCPEDCKGGGNSGYLQDGSINTTDQLFVLAEWGSSCSQADVNGDGDVDSADLLAVLGAWGACP